MGLTDGKLDATSRRLLDEVEQLRQLEIKKRRTARNSPEFHDLAAEVDNVARHVFETASTELIDGSEDSPIEAERDEQEQHPGDWTDRPPDRTSREAGARSPGQAGSSDSDR